MSIIDPSIDRLIKRVPSKYLLVVGAARRGRELMDGAAQLVPAKSNKPVTVALEEIVAGMVTLTPPQGGSK